MTTDLKSRYERNGFFVVDRQLPDWLVEELRVEADCLLEDSTCRGGARNVLHRSPRLRREAVRPEFLGLVKQILGPRARPTKLTLFNKTQAANWLIRWHQDLVITVRERHDTPGFSGWSLKEGIVHVRPPVHVLEAIVALRVHLDDTPATNGALRVLPGSHRYGRLTREQIQQQRGRQREHTCEVGRGGVMLMSPLLLHASAKASSPAKRRVLHFEYSARELPGALGWA